MTTASWRPRLIDGEAPVYVRLVAALEADIVAGDLPAGTRLPTHRQLAEEMGVGVGTITRAYAEAESRGLITARVGAGSYVAEGGGRGGATRATDGAIDLARNVPPPGPAEAALARTLPRLARRADVADTLAYPPPAGSQAARRAGALWLTRMANWPAIDPGRLICTAGAQQAIATAILAASRPGDAMVTEGATFHGARMLADQAGLSCVPAEMDAEGMTPEGLTRAARESGARIAYVLPLQNPTSRLMGAERRRQIVEAASKLDLLLVEDDLFAAQATGLGLPPLAVLAPERTFYVTSLSKALAPGLRVGYLAPPPTWFERCQDALRAIAFGSPTFGALIATDWIERGEAFEIAGAVNAELRRRTDMARAALDGVVEPVARPIASHIWLPLSELDAERVAGQALRGGVELTPPRSPFLDGVPVSGLRLCLGAAADEEALGRGLAIVRAALDPAARPTLPIV
ncbi:MAG: PLP-dependent aminotransferase family protein [Proteobacteria bacterium]|nr:PLP-dependent aminotransferase family protein [Pseudomonadota bacterium]